jgi:hypothetical protein
MHNFLEKFKHSNIPIHATKEVNPHRHWVILLKVFFVGLSVLVFGSIYLLYQIENEQFVPSVSVSKQQETVLKESLISSVSVIMKNKMEFTMELDAHPLAYPDPSK